MAINPASAAAAYANAMKTLAGPGAGGAQMGAAQAGEAQAAGSSFAEMVKEAVSGAVDASKTAEAKAISGATSKAEIVDVVTAVTNAELMLQTVVAVRDKVVAAYQDIMKMPI